MKTVFDKATREELINRINHLNENSEGQWGKMTVYQMVKHCRLWEEMTQGKIISKRVFIGRLFGRMALKMMLKDDKPMGKNAPTSKELIVKEPNGDFVSERNQWIALLHEYDHFSPTGFIHPFFGKMTKEQIGYFAYKHTDHHLRQFNC